MPNCDFYATPEDHEGLLAWLLAEGACEVHELGSDFGQPLRRFRSAGEVLAQFERRYPNGRKWRALHLQLYFSSRLNREIRKRGVAKIGSRAILPGALELWNAGVAMGPWKPGEHALQGDTSP